MKLSQYKKDFYDFSGKASDAARSAAFAGIALAWVFKIDGESVSKLPEGLLLPTGLLALGLGLDLLQYVAGATIWGVFHRIKEKELDNEEDDPELKHSPFLPGIINSIFALKLASVMAGYIYLILYVWQEWK